MTDRELGILQFSLWALLIYVLVLAVIGAWRLFLRNGDVVAQAAADTAAADEVLHDHASIDSFVTDWFPVSTSTAIAEALYVDRQRGHR